MLVTASDGLAWFKSDPAAGVLRLGGMLGHNASSDFIPAIVLSMNGDVTWRELRLDEVSLLSTAGTRLVQGACRLAEARGTPLRLTYERDSIVHRVLEEAHLVPAGDIGAACAPVS
jgi:hypothetical protein